MKKALTYLFILSLAFPTISSAVTIEELQSQINSLLLQISMLREQMSGQTGQTCPVFLSDLQFGATGNDVISLHKVLEREGFDINSAETSSARFGESTASGVVGFQERYRSEVLTPAGLLRGTGYVGARTRARLNSLNCSGSNVNSYTPAPQAPINVPPVNTYTTPTQNFSPAPQPPTIYSIQSAGNPVGTLYSNDRASIYGTGLRGQLSIKIGSQESQILSITGISDTYAEFTVPSRTQASPATISVTNSSGLSSSPYQVNIRVANPTAPVITSIRSSGNSEGTITADRTAEIFGTGLSGTLTVRVGTQGVLINNSASDTYAEFRVPYPLTSPTASVTVTNSNGQTSNSYQVNIVSQ